MEVGGENIKDGGEVDDVVVLVGQQVSCGLFKLFVVHGKVHLVLEQPEE